MTRQRTWFCIGSGCLWGGIGYLCARPFLREAAAGAVIISPLIGAAAGVVLSRLRPRDLGALVIAAGLVLCATAAAFGFGAQVTAELGFTSRPFTPLDGSAIQRLALAPLVSVLGAGLFGVVLAPLAFLNTFVFYNLDEPVDRLAG